MKQMTCQIRPLFFQIIMLQVLLLVGVLPLTAQLNVQITPSRISGVAPLYVFFDATATTGLTGINDLALTDFTWNFDAGNIDPSGSWEQTKDMVAGHVFEEAGVYTISCQATAPDGSVDTETLTITVTSFSGTTYYVSNMGSDANDGLTESTPWQTANFAFSQLSPNERILFRRGETFTSVNGVINNQSGGAMIIDAYGAGASPILQSTTNLTVISIFNSDDVRLLNLHLINTGTGNESRGVRCENNSTDILLLNMELEGAEAFAVYPDDADVFGVFDCYLHDFGVIGAFVNTSTRFSWVGNTMNNLIGTVQPEHGMRVQGGEKHFIAHNSFTHLVDTKTAMTIRGNNQQHVMIYDNMLDRILQVAPTNHSQVQAIYHVVLEGNYIGHNADYYGSNFEPTPNGIVVEATRVAVRNNIIDGYARAVNVRTQNVQVDAGNVDIYNNTANWRSVSPVSGTGGIMVLAQDAHDINVRNNLISAPTLAQATVYQESNTIGELVSNNVATTTPGYITNPLPNSAAHDNNPTNYQLISSSPAVNAGGNDVPVFFDKANAIRPIGINKDAGAFEYSGIVLPVELIHFWADRVDEVVNLHWETAREWNNNGFWVEKSTDAYQWQSIGFVKGKAASSEFNTYRYTDIYPNTGLNYYRLKQEDFDGTTTITKAIVLDFKQLLTSIFPNPASDRMIIKSTETQISKMAVFNLLGQEMKDFLIEKRGEQGCFILDISHLPNGVYYLKFGDEIAAFTKK